MAQYRLLDGYTSLWTIREAYFSDTLVALLSRHQGQKIIPSDLGGLSHSHEDIAQLPGLVE